MKRIYNHKSCIFSTELIIQKMAENHIFTRRELAEKSGIHHMTAGRAVNGKPVSLYIAIKIASILNIDLKSCTQLIESNSSEM